jgi:hypothetical protein
VGAENRRMRAHRLALRVPQLDVVGRNRDVLRAQILGQYLADLAVADQSHLPLLRIGCHQSIYFRPAFSSGSRIL